MKQMEVWLRGSALAAINNLVYNRPG